MANSSSPSLLASSSPACLSSPSQTIRSQVPLILKPQLYIHLRINRHLYSLLKPQIHYNHLLCGLLAPLHFTAALSQEQLPTQPQEPLLTPQTLLALPLLQVSYNPSRPLALIACSRSVQYLAVWQLATNSPSQPGALSRCPPLLVWHYLTCVGKKIFQRTPLC